MNETMSGTDPWSPVDESRTTVNEVEPDAPVEVHSGNVTARINLGGDEPAEQKKTAAAEQAAEPDKEEQSAAEDAETEEAEQRLAEKLAALDAVKTSRRKK